MAGWASPADLVREELKQSAEEGKPRADIDAIGRAVEPAAAAGDETALAELHQRLLDLPLREGWAYDEPDGLEAIRALSEGSASQPPPRGEALRDRLRGAWLGRCAGCALGKPVEPFMEPHGGLSSRERVRRYLTAIDPAEWPIRGYIPEHSPAEGETGATLWPASTREHIAFVETDDDLRYTVLGQMILRDHGTGFTSADVMKAWLEHLGAALVCTAETQAYRNVVGRYVFHHGPLPAIDWAWVATHQNPYREWIGAAIRVDAYAYAVPGDPARAAELAWRDARISHTRNGIYAAMFNAAMIAAAFTTADPRRIIDAGLACIPRASRLHEAVRWTVDRCDAHGRRFTAFERVHDEIEQQLGHYHPVHAINNAAVVVAALLLGSGDYGRTIALAVMAGWDTDCNAATAGSICGAALGAEALPVKWIDPLNDTLYSGIPGYHPISISECAARSLHVVGQPERDEEK